MRDAQEKNATFKRHPELEVIGISPGACPSFPPYAACWRVPCAVLCLGVSLMTDDLAKQSSFADQHNLPYPLLCDTQGAARTAYNVGKAFFGLSDARETFFIDRRGVVAGHYEANMGFAYVCPSVAQPCRCPCRLVGRSPEQARTVMRWGD